MIFINTCTECEREWPCTARLTMCLRCTEAKGLTYGKVH